MPDEIEQNHLKILVKQDAKGMSSVNRELELELPMWTWTLSRWHCQKSTTEVLNFTLI